MTRALRQMAVPAALAFVMLSFLVLAASEQALEAEDALNAAQKDMEQMVSDGLPVTRYNDTLLLAQQIMEVQLNNENAGAKPDYSVFYGKIDELKDLKQKAYAAVDELRALAVAINQTEGIDTAPVWDIYREAKAEFDNERYEQSTVLIDRGYEKISELEAIQTKIVAFAESTSRNVTEFLKALWKELLTASAIIIAIVVLTYNRIQMMLIRRRIAESERRRESVKNLTGETQRKYFERGEISDTTYHIRTKKYGEMIRDINRRIPLLREELELRRKRKI